MVKKWTNFRTHCSTKIVIFIIMYTNSTCAGTHATHMVATHFMAIVSSNHRFVESLVTIVTANQLSTSPRCLYK